jgi:predicted nucleotidyltransferase
MGELGERLAKIARRFKIANVYVFGSRSAEITARLRGQRFPAVSPGSDVDIGVEPRTGVPLASRERVRLTIELEDLFDAARVDLIVLSEAPPFLALDVIRGELVYCEDPDQQAESELFVLRRAGDLAPFERQRRKMILEEGGR